MKEFFIQLNFKNEGKSYVGPFKDEWMADLFLADIPRRQFDKDEGYIGIESAIKVTNYKEQLENTKNTLRRSYASRRSIPGRGGEK